MSLAPFVRRFYILNEHRGLNASKELGQKWDEYEDNLMSESVLLTDPGGSAERVHAERDSLIKTSSEDKYYAEILGRYLRNEAQSEVAKATRGGKKLP